MLGASKLTLADGVFLWPRALDATLPVEGG